MVGPRERSRDAGLTVERLSALASLGEMEPTNAPELYTVAQFVVPRIAADALDLSRIVREARDSGMVAPNIEMNIRHAGPRKIRVTCRTLMALRLMAEWKRIAASAPQTDHGAQLRESIFLASAAATAACCKAWSPRKLSMGETGFVG